MSQFFIANNRSKSQLNSTVNATLHLQFSPVDLHCQICLSNIAAAERNIKRVFLCIIYNFTVHCPLWDIKSFEYDKKFIGILQLIE